MRKPLFGWLESTMRLLFKIGQRGGDTLCRERGIPKSAAVEPMERRALLSGEISVSQFTSFDSFTPSWDEPQVAVDANGDFVVTWGNANTSNSEQVMAQRFTASGSLIGTSIQVSGNTTGYADAPNVAMDAAGDFDITWNDGGERFNSGANPLGSLPGSPTEYQPAPVSSDSQGDIAIITPGISYNSGPTLQRYSSSGATVGSAVTLPPAYTSDLAMNASGSFVTTTWGSQGILVQAFASNGTPATSSILANQASSGNDPRFPCVSMNSSGAFVVAWQSYTTHPGIYAQLYSAAGTPVGSNILVSATGEIEGRDVAMLPNGGFDVSWISPGPTGYGPVELRAFSSLATPLGSAQTLSSPSEITCLGVDLSTNASGGVDVVWGDYPAVPGGTGEIIADIVPEPASAAIVVGSAYLMLRRPKRSKTRPICSLGGTHVDHSP